jgi:preprotein translocase subunit SecD
MKNIRELLLDADPLRHEATRAVSQRDFRRQAVLAVASGVRTHAGAETRSRIVVSATVALMVLAVSLLGPRVRSLFVSDAQAAVRFEARLAEDRPAPGLREAKASDSGRSVYLHDEIIATNSDIKLARVIQGSDPSQYAVGIEFNAAGAEKMRVATGNHIGKLVAILLDGKVVMAPVIRTAIGPSAVITGKFTRSQAEKIVNGIKLQ